SAARTETMDRGSIARTILGTARPATHPGPVRGTPTRPGSRKVLAATKSVPKWPSRRSTRVPAQAEHPGNAKVSVSALELFHIHRRRDKTGTPQELLSKVACPCTRGTGFKPTR